MKLLQPFLVALQLLTRLPVHLPPIGDRRVLGRSLLYYPIVGLILGFTITALDTLLSGVPDTLRAALVLTTWVLLTGALHLDGLADSADAWIGGIGSRKRTLAIMKDPYCGPAAVVALVLVLIVKFSALLRLDPGTGLILALIPTLSRTAIPLLFLTTRYVRPGGIGAGLTARMPRAGMAVVIALTLATVVWTTGADGLWLLLAAGMTFMLLRTMMVKRLGGTTGDTAGALIELSETALLVTAALLRDSGT